MSKMSMKNHKDLEVWKKSVAFVTEIYRISKSFPKEEIYGLTSQLRRAAVSIPSNIAEGAARQSNKDFERFLFISLGSISEVETQLIISKNLEYLNENEFETLQNKLIEMRKMLLGLIKYFDNQKR